MEQEVKACYTPEEICRIVFANTVSVSTVRGAIRTGQIPSIRLGQGTRTKILIPASYVLHMKEKGYGVEV